MTSTATKVDQPSTQRRASFFDGSALLQDLLSLSSEASTISLPDPRLSPLIANTFHASTGRTFQVAATKKPNLWASKSTVSHLVSAWASPRFSIASVDRDSTHVCGQSRSALLIPTSLAPWLPGGLVDCHSLWQFAMSPPQQCCLVATISFCDC